MTLEFGRSLGSSCLGGAPVAIIRDWIHTAGTWGRDLATYDMEDRRRLANWTFGAQHSQFTILLPSISTFSISFFPPSHYASLAGGFTGLRTISRTQSSKASQFIRQKAAYSIRIHAQREPHQGVSPVPSVSSNPQQPTPRLRWHSSPCAGRFPAAARRAARRAAAPPRSPQHPAALRAARTQTRTCARQSRG